MRRQKELEETLKPDSVREGMTDWRALKYNLIDNGNNDTV